MGIGTAPHSEAGSRRLDCDVIERICLALVAQRCLEPAPKLAAVRWSAERMALVEGPDCDDQTAYATMDFLLAAPPDIAERILAATANLLNLICDII